MSELKPFMASQLPPLKKVSELKRRIKELEAELENTRTQSQWISEERLKELCESYAKYSHLASILRVVPNYQNWLIDQGLSTKLPPKAGE